MYNQLDTITIKYLLKVRVHLGRHQKQLEQKINSYLYGIKHNISIFNIEKIFWILRHFFQNLINFFNEQNSFFIVATESKLPIKQFLRAFEKNKIFQYSIYNTLHFDGFIQHKWLNGLFSNWKIIFNLLKKINTLEKSLKRKTYKNLIKHFEGLKYKKKNPVLVDFVLVLNSNNKVLNEILRENIPTFGITDSNQDPSWFFYSLIMNNNSIESIKLFFYLLESSLKESILKEQELLCKLIWIKIKNILNKTIL